MNKALEIIDYLSNVTNAITKGLKAVYDNWPVNSPFSNGSGKSGDGVEK